MSPITGRWQKDLDDGRYDLCDCGHNRNWHYRNAGDCCAEIRYFPEQMANCPCQKFTLKSPVPTEATK